MATCDLQSSPDRDRFIRLIRLLIAGGTPILRDILKQYHTPASLVTALRGTRIGFTKPQKLLVSPPSGLDPDFEKFDISLLFKLLRNCCGLTEPATKWNALPLDGDNSLEADVTRIDYYRNDIYGHALEHMALTQQDFGQYWRIISDTLCRRAIDLPGINVTALRNKIYELRFSGLTDDDRRRFEEGLRIESMLAEQNKKLDNIEAKEDQLREGIEGLQNTMISAIQRTNISDDKTTTVQITNITYGPNYFSDQAQHPQPSVAQGIRRQTSDGTIPHQTLQRSYKKSLSLPSNVSLSTPSSQERFRNPVNSPFPYPFQSPQTAEQHQQMSDRPWQSPTPAAATFAPHTGLDHDASSYIGQHQSPARFSQEPSPNPDGFRFLDTDSRAVPRRHEWQSPNHTTAASVPRGESSKASYMIGRKGLTDPLPDEAAATSTWAFPSYPDVYHTTRPDRWPSPVSPSVSRHEYPGQLGQDPLLRITISISGVKLPAGFRLSEVVQSALLETSSERLNAAQFTGYLEKHELTIEKIQGNEASCFIGVCPRNLESLLELWHDFIHQDLKEFVRETVLPEDFEGEVHVDIDGEEYKRCCERLKPRGFRDSGRSLHSQSLSEMAMAWDDVQEPFPGSLSRTRSKSVVDLSRPDVYQELFQLLCKNGGRMPWQTAINNLPYSYRSECTKPAFRQNMHSYKLEFLANNVIRAKVSLRFCPNMRKDRVCNNTNCPDLHLCRFHFSPRGCQFSTNCKNSHDISDHHTDNVFRVANLLFLNNDERKQLLGNVAYVAPEICFYYNRNTCTKGMHCPCLHVCKDWVAGRRCVAGNACGYAHTFKNQHEQNILQKKNLDYLSDREVLEKLNDHPS